MKRREDDAGQEGEMLDFLQWSAALLALAALSLWFWSGVPSAEPAIRRKRQIGARERRRGQHRQRVHRHVMAGHSDLVRHVMAEDIGMNG